MKAFKAYDIRGIYNEDFNKEDAYKIGYFLPELLQADNVLVGRDVRVSSNEIFEYLAQGIIDSGANVYNIGISTTPMVYYITAKHKFALKTLDDFKVEFFEDDNGLVNEVLMIQPNGSFKAKRKTE